MSFRLFINVKITPTFEKVFGDGRLTKNRRQHDCTNIIQDKSQHKTDFWNYVWLFVAVLVVASIEDVLV